MAEVVKHKKDLARLNMSEDEAITVYTFSIVVLGLFVGKRSTKSDMGHFPDYTKWCNESLQTDLGYYIEKMLDPVHQDIKMTIVIAIPVLPLCKGAGH